jgi:hypothetical protein
MVDQGERVSGMTSVVVPAHSQLKQLKVMLKFFADPAAYEHERMAYQVGRCSST